MIAGMTRRQWMAAGTAALAAPPRRPNVLLILTDDQGYGDLSLHGNPYLKTPNLDRLAGQGVEFTRFYVSPVCAPTRASLLTGRYHLRTGVHGVTHGRETMRTEEVTLAEALGEAGYRTALYGKWHLGEHYPYVPHAQGFEEFIGFRTGHWMNYFDTELERNGKPYPTRGYITDVLTEHAVRYLEAHRREPFFLYLAYNAPHSPFQVPERYFRPFKAMGLDNATAAVYAMVTNLDENIGRLMHRLEELGLAEETIVIFLTDNGPNGRRFVSGLRARKGAVYEGGIRAPFFIRWPGRLPEGRKLGQMAAHIDLYPTLLELCGVKPPPGPELDGSSLVPLLKGDGSGWPDRMFFTHQTARNREGQPYPGAVRTSRFSLINGTELYDLQADPGEKINVAGDHPDEARRLRAAYEAWFETAGRQCGFTRRPIPVGYREEDPVTLPAPQSYFTDGLSFHGGPGWAHDWLTGWTDTRDYAWWEVEVVREGEFDVALRYLCPKSSVGAKILVEAPGAKLEAAVSEPTSMEPRPALAVFDEPGYPIMDFGRLAVGRIRLAAGRARIAVKALSKPGERVMDLKELILTRLG